MIYGIPYQGSKNRIAEDLMKVLPSGNRFIDLFGGGGAMSHIAVLSKKYNEVIYNDINPNIVKLLQDAVDGKYNFENFKPHFISRDEFFEWKESDAYIKYCWSFSRQGKEYLYSEEKEHIKYSIFNYIVYGIRDEYIEQNHPQIELMSKGIWERKTEWIATIKNIYGLPSDDPKIVELRVIEPLAGIKRLQALEGLPIKFTCLTYQDYNYQYGDIIYCDPPYEQSTGYNDIDFDSVSFYEWVSNQSYPIYFSSYDNISDARFSPIWAEEERNLMGGVINAKIKVEALYVNHPIDFQFNNYEYVKASHSAKKVDLFLGQ